MPDAVVRVASVCTRREMREFVALPYVLHRGDRWWVPPLIGQQRAFLDPSRNPYFAHAEVELHLARRGDRIVGRVSSQIDRLHDEAHGESAAMFGFFEAADDEAAAALLEHAATWARQRGATVLRGPASFSLNHECGLIVAGFDAPPVTLMPYTPPHYVTFVERAGFAKAMDLLCFRLRRSDIGGDPGKLPPKLQRVAEKAAQRSGVVVRAGDKRRYEEEMRRGFAVYNRAWAGNWGFVPVTADELRYFSRELRPIVEPRLSLFAEVDGEPVGFAACVIDANQILRHLGGRLLPFGWVKGLLLRRRVDAVRFLLFGVLEAYRGRGVDALLVLELLQRALAAGYETLDLTWILESNEPVLRLIANLGAPWGIVPYRRYRIYERPLTG